MSQDNKTTHIVQYTFISSNTIQSVHVLSSSDTDMCLLYNMTVQRFCPWTFQWLERLMQTSLHKSGLASSVLSVVSFNPNTSQREVTFMSAMLFIIRKKRLTSRIITKIVYLYFKTSRYKHRYGYRSASCKMRFCDHCSITFPFFA